MPETRGTWIDRLAAVVARRPGQVLAAGLLLTVLALWPASKLRLETNLAALLPAGHPAAEDYHAFLDAFGGFEKVFLMLLPADGAATTAVGPIDAGHLLEAAGRLAELLRASPEVAEVRSGLEPEDEEFFLRFVVRRAPLLLPDAAVDGLAARLSDESVRAQAASLRAQLHSPAGAAKLKLVRHDPLELSLDLPLFGAAGLDLPVDPVSGGFLARATDGQPPAALVMLTPAASEVDPDSGRRLLAELDRAWSELESQMADDLPPGSLRLLKVGGPLYAVQDETIIRSDLESTIAGSAIGCALLLLLAFGGPRIPLATLAGLGVALLWAAGVLGATVGELTAPGLGFAAVLVGLGIDYGIHGGVRYRQGRLDGLGATDSLAATYRDAGPAIVTSAATTAVAFATLGLAHFRPLRELGIVVALGIVAILAGSATVGASLVALGGRREKKPSAGGLVWRALDAGARSAVDLAVRFPVAVLVVAALLSVLGAWGTARLGLSTDMRALRPEHHPALEAEEVLSRRFAVGLDTTTLVVRGDDLSETLARCDAAAAVLRRRVPGAEVVSPTEWLVAPGRSQERLRHLEALPFARAAEVLDQALREQNLAPRAFASGLDALRAFGRGEDPGAPTAEDFPSGLAELLRFDEKDGDEGGGVQAALRARLPDGTWPGGPPDDVLTELDAAAPGVAVASVIRLGGALKDIAARDLEVLLTAALGVVALVVMVAFRGSLRRSLLAMTPVALGCLWTLGAWGALGRDIDLLGLAVVPILLGIGIDDGLHAVHGSAREHGGDGLVASIRHAGLAMTLTTLTTAIGFASLLLSSLPGLQAGGFLVAGGVVACLAATLLVLPALASCGKKSP